MNTKQFIDYLHSIKYEDITYVSIKRKEWIRYLRIYSGFDIETTSINEHAYMYIWQWSFMLPNSECIVVKGRTWDEFTELYEELLDHLCLRPTTRLIVWIANMGYEFQWLRKIIPMDEVFAKTRRNPLKAYSCGIEFRDCLSISQGSLAYLAKSWTKTQKALGDLDYSIIRNSKTALTSIEEGYCDNDVIILAEFSEQIFNKFLSTQKYIPLTSTGILRHELKKKALESVSNDDIIYNYIKSLFPKSKGDYIFTMNYLFRGGYVHANFAKTGYILNNMHSFDFKSSYPAHAFCEYPITPFKRCKKKSLFEKALREKDVIMKVSFWCIESTTTHSIESKSKCIELILDRKKIRKNGEVVKDKNGAEQYLFKGLLDNGRVRSAYKMTVELTQLDFDSYKKFYRWKKMTIHNFYIAEKGYLPRYILDQFYYWFNEKETINKHERPQDYAISKTRVNGLFGLTVTRLCFEDVIYDDDNEECWDYAVSSQTYDQMISRQVLSPFWGIYITAHARHSELDILYRLKDEVVYSDTDSHKCIMTSNVMHTIHNWNVERKKFNHWICEKYGYDYNIIGKLGCMEWETSPHEHGTIKRFMTLGAKRYLCEYENDGFESTISGLGKKSLKEYAEYIDKDPFDMFAAGMCIPHEYTHKLSPVYIDEPVKDIVTDNEGNEEEMREKSCVYLAPVDFTLSLDKDYETMINEVLQALERKRRYK